MNSFVNTIGSKPWDIICIYQHARITTYKKVFRIISFSDYRAHTGPLFRNLKIMTLTRSYNLV